MILTPTQRLRIRARSFVAEETLSAYLKDPTSVRTASAMRIEEAARAEGIHLVQAPSAAALEPVPSATTQ